MPFDARDLPPPPGDRRAAYATGERLVGMWLVAIAAMLLVMIVLGGVTRLTGSGLSIMEWAPISGMIPPLTGTEWQRLFDLYRTIPQYRLLFPDLDLAGFQGIFWLEWAHRLWGRLIGLAFFVPLVWFWLEGLITPRLRLRLVLLFVLGGMQGLVGWVMVASGFAPNAASVSAYRLVAHLVLGVSLYAAILWTALGVLRPVAQALPGATRARTLVALTTLLLALTVAAGGFVAGLHAGLVYNSFPLMDGAVLPRDYAALSPFVRNLFENVSAVQFDHRLLATLTTLAAIVAVAVALRSPLSGFARRASLAFAAAIAVQYALGVATLLEMVPVPLAAAHQAGALLALTAALVLLHGLRGARPLRRW